MELLFDVMDTDGTCQIKGMAAESQIGKCASDFCSIFRFNQV